MGAFHVKLKQLPPEGIFNISYFGFSIKFGNVSHFLLIIISIQPLGLFWQEPEPSQVTGMALAHRILGKFLEVVCHCFPLPLDVPTSGA
jgi:hypothetical protein